MTDLILLGAIAALVLIGGAVYVIASLHGTIAMLRREINTLKQVNATMDTNCTMWRCRYNALHDAIMAMKDVLK